LTWKKKKADKQSCLAKGAKVLGQAQWRINRSGTCKKASTGNGGKKKSKKARCADNKLKN
jgi:hypothetical protein